MDFFDLSVPYDGKDSGGEKNLRVKLAMKAMELGYVGIAYNRSMKGIMTEKDRCSIPLLTVESLVKIAPPMVLSVGLNRDLLGIRRDTPFRQYTRLTVSVENNAQALALNSDNPILKSYDIVAVKPLNQTAFDQACEKTKVDMISIDLSGNLPFRLKQSMVKAAIQRGIYFEIKYSDLIMDPHKRKHVKSNGKLLVAWTRGKNLIITSSAPSVTEMRGPHNVMNLVSLFGLSTERARAALSNNCKNMIRNALRRKRFFKDTIRVEFASSNDKFSLDKPLPEDWLRWDPLSSCEGDMALDDFTKKAFDTINGADPKSTSKAIDFTSVLNDLPSNGFQLNAINVNEPVKCNNASEPSSTASDGYLREDRPTDHDNDQIAPEMSQVHIPSASKDGLLLKTNDGCREVESKTTNTGLTPMDCEEEIQILDQMNVTMDVDNIEEDGKHEIGEKDVNIYNISSGITDLVRESDNSDQSLRLRCDNEETETQNDHKIYTSPDKTNGPNSVKQRSRKRRVAILPQYQPFKPFLNLLRFKRNNRRSKRRRVSS